MLLYEVSVTMVAVLLGVSMAYKTGPPVTTHPDICGTMLPQHDVYAQTVAAPFEVKADDCFNETVTLNVHVKIKTEGETFFEGFFLQARLSTGGVPNNTASYGTFSTDDDELSTLQCFKSSTNSAGTENAIGHNQAHHYDNKVVQWQGSGDLAEGDTIYFVATVVRHDYEIWLDVWSDAVTYSAACTPELPATPYFTAGPAPGTTPGTTPDSGRATTTGISILAAVLTAAATACLAFRY